MRRGFSILELLVAAMLLSMMMTIMLMVFNQSSVAWRTATAGQLSLEDVRQEVVTVRRKADDAYAWDSNGHMLLGIWDELGNLRHRTVTSSEATGQGLSGIDITDLGNSAGSWAKPNLPGLVKSATSTRADPVRTYVINVKSNGPNRTPDDYDDIWSYPDDFD